MCVFSLLSDAVDPGSSDPLGPDVILVEGERGSEHRYRCQQCGKVYVWAKGLRDHQRYECGKEPQHQCPACPLRFKLSSNMRRHLRRQHNMEVPKGHRGHPGGTRSKRIAAAKGILLGPRSCGSSGSRPRPAEPLFCCDVCGKSYLWEASLKGHQRYECGKAPHHACAYCDLKFKLRGNLKRHLRRSHNKCRIAGWSLTDGLDTYASVHAQQYADPLAGYGPARGGFVCPTCNKSYAHRSSLSHHTRFECGKEPQFKCPHCPHRCKRRGSVWPQLHQFSAAYGGQTWPSRRPQRKGFQCKDCGKVYSHQPSLCKHRRFECGKEPQFHCPYCPHRTKHKHALQSHMKSQHEWRQDATSSTTSTTPSLTLPEFQQDSFQFP
ncbi:Zinc finger protein 875 [Frankliniella fusca]|uniref:Zinc finger protein 875 n=1 Tax=Frankliniella fusca TaxID=407009 RepID=A0AAE1LCZ3_9NEOP|nr:Zinc finger protein 875 [Frankliniella fusca]